MTTSSPVDEVHLRAVLAKLADIATPPPPDWAPRTWGWAGVAAVLLALAGWALYAWARRRAAGRYRVEALAELARLEDLAREDAAGALIELPALIKRVALAEFPRAEVAPLSERRWTDFVAKRSAGGFAGPLADLLREGEYRAERRSAPDAGACLGAARRWIEGRRVSA